MDIENIELGDVHRKLADIMEQAENLIQEKNELKRHNEHLRELARAQQDKLNNIYEASARAQHEAKLWEYRYRHIERRVRGRLEITPDKHTLRQHETSPN
ncbi:hypothetical protein ABLV94_07240 [Staphylococcus sp. Mo2-7]